MVKAKKILTFIFVSILLAGCAVNPVNPQDPYEKFNRKMFAFNMAVDKVVIRPVALLYSKALPDPVQTGVSNFFNNIGEVPTVANDILQLHIGQAVADSWRFLVNSTLGVGGLFDVATRFGLKRNYEDFGLTLARWGVKKSEYLVLPILGPSTARDTVGLLVNYYGLSVYPHIHPFALRAGLLSLDYISIRSSLLPADKLMRESFDPYVFVRNAYLQRRKYLMEEKYPNKAEGADYLLDEESTS